MECVLKQQVIAQIQFFIDDVMDKYRLRCVKDVIVDEHDDEILQWKLIQRTPHYRKFQICQDEIFIGLQDKDYG